MSSIPPAPPTHLPEMPGLPRESRYRRPRRYINWMGLILGLVIGISGGLIYTWNLAPVSEFDTAPWQLNKEHKDGFVVAVILNWSYDGDLSNAVNRLLELRLEGDDPIQQVADVACQLASSGYVDSTSGLRAIRTLIQFYELQGRTGCAGTLIPNPTSQGQITIIPPTSTPTLAPPPTKTPTPQPADSGRPSPTSPVIIVPTTPPQGDFRVARVETFCDAELSGVIEVRVREASGNPLPGMRIRVRWDTGEDLFTTGLKPERGQDYADFQMEAGKGYTVEMPGRSNPTQSLNATPCATDAGQEAITSFRVVFTGS
jgi:hypothetical protein